MEDSGNLKRIWPELQGVNVDVAIEKIKQENNELNVIKVHANSAVTKDFRLDRVRVFFDPESNLVKGTPKVG